MLLKERIVMGFGIIESLRRVITGKVIQKADVSLGNYITVSLRLKSHGDDLYVVLACKAPGNAQYYPMDLRQFAAFTDAILRTKAAIENSNNPE